MTSYINKRNIHFFFKSKHSTKKKNEMIQESQSRKTSEQTKIKVDNIFKYLSTLNFHARKEYISNLKVLEEFKSPHHYSASVYLLDNYIVRKNLKRNRMGFFLFQNEIMALQKLQPYDHFPKLLGYNNNQMSIYMTFCGEQINSNNIPDDWEKQLDDIEHILLRVKVNSNDMILRNVCVLNKVIYIIDFGLYSKFGVSIRETVSKLRYELRKISNKN